MTQDQLERAIQFIRDEGVKRVEEGARQDQRIAHLSQVINQEAENIRALARIAEAHKPRLTDLEGSEV